MRWFAVVPAVFAAAGCNLLTPVIFVGEPKRKVTAEFNKLAGARTAVLVWTEPATLFDYPHARFELSTYIGDKLAQGLADRGMAIDVVDPRDVEDFIQKDIDAQSDPQRVGRRFRADYVVYLEMVRFQIRDPEQPQLLRGRLAASVAVYDMRSAPGSPTRYALTPVEAIHPETGPVLLTATNSLLIREACYRKFAELVARKFYEYTVAM
ncbi:MAG: hypothetical protein ACE5E6_06290 [Phycisphaerae bacterium]